MQFVGKLKKLDFNMLHTFLDIYGGYAAFVSVGLCVSMWLARAVYSRSWVYVFMIWNLFLAIIPYVCSVFAFWIHTSYPKRVLPVVLLAIMAIAFFPNAPYIVTDLMHLSWLQETVPLWFDVGMLATFAWTGVMLGVYGLRLLHGIVQDWLGQVWGWLFVLVIIGLSGVGIYMGRFLRWNSWDLVVQPREVIMQMLDQLGNPIANPRTYGVSLMFAAFLLICYLAMTFGPNVRDTRDSL